MPSITHIHNRIMEYLEKTAEETGLPKWWLYFDCVFNCAVHKKTVRDYFIFKFYYLNLLGKHEYLSGLEQNKWQDKHNDRRMEAILVNKEKCLKHFESFILRDWCGITERATREEYESFAEKHSRAIFKPLDSCGGKGIKILSLADIPGGVFQFCHEQHYLMEELIEQDTDLKTLYPNSVNTIRIVTLDRKIIGAVLRIGKSGSGVDNLSAGGIAAAIDADSGIVITTGKTYLGEEYVRHPDTGVIIPGFVIPQWKDCIKYVTQAADLCKGIPCVGWDIAVTPNGPTIVEINEGTEIEALQMPYEKGYRRVIMGK